MIVQHNGEAHNLIGDTHLGLGFKTGVPLHRRGEREAMVWAEFERQLNIEADYTVQVGDLFDSPDVSKATVARTIDLVSEAAARQPHTRFFFMAGNHDRSRQPGVVSSFDLFARGVRHLWETVTVVTEPMVTHNMLLLPWQWGVPALDQLANFQPEAGLMAVCHHDLETFGGHDAYLLPAARLRDLGCSAIYTGHWHIPGDYTVERVPVVCTGSMLPYRRNEDPEGSLYVTVTEDELEGADLRNKCVRLVLRKGTEVPNLDALAVEVVWEDDQHQDVAAVAADFELSEALIRAFDNNKVPQDTRDFIKERLSL